MTRNDMIWPLNGAEDPAPVPAAGWGSAAFAGASQTGQMEHRDPSRLAPPPPLPDPWRHFPAGNLELRTPVADDLAKGWSHLFAIRCAHSAAPHSTPIPCGAVFRDPEAGTFGSLRRAANAAGWRLDSLGRWACPACAQESGEFRSLYPVTLWDGRAAEARRAADGGWASWVTEDNDLIPVPAEFPLVVALEQRLRESVLAAAIRPRHRKAVTA